MQYCSKCKAVCEDKITFCPSCKRKTSLRGAKSDDLVFLLKTSEYECSELEELFYDNGVKFEIKPYKSSKVSSVYDSSFVPTDKVIYVEYSDLDTVKVLMEKISDGDEEIEDIPTPDKKSLVKQAVMIIAYICAIMLFALLMWYFGNFISPLF